jgi:alkylhydroperoxidase family enzyme
LRVSTENHYLLALRKKSLKIQFKGGYVMAVINPLSKEDAAASVHGLYDAFAQKFGHMLNIFAVMAYRPEVLSSFVPFFQSLMAGGTLGNRDKELAYLATSMLNGCEY